MSSAMDGRVSKLEALVGGDGTCQCPGRERCVPTGHVDGNGVLWYANPESCPDCGGSTVVASVTRYVIINMSDSDTPLDLLPFGGYDRWHPAGPPPGREEEIYPTGVADVVERSRTTPGGSTHLVWVPIDDLMGGKQ